MWRAAECLVTTSTTRSTSSRLVIAWHFVLASVNLGGALQRGPCVTDALLPGVNDTH